MRGKLHTWLTVVLFVGLGPLLYGCGPGPKPAERRPPPEGHDEGRKRPRSPPPVPSRPPTSVAIGDADIVRRDCAPSADVPGFRRLAPIKHNSVLAGDCGELVWKQPESNALHYLGLDAEPREVSADGWALWFQENRILYGDEDGLTLEDGGSMTRTWPGIGVGIAGKLQGVDSFWACSKNDGILRLEEDGSTVLTPDFLILDGGYGSGCWGIDASPSGTIAYPTDLHRVGVVDALTGSTRTIDHPFYPNGTSDETDLFRADAVRLSPDGTLVFHEKRWHEQWGHVSVEVGEGEIAVFEADASEPVRISGVLKDGWEFIGLGWIWYGPWMGTTAPGVFVPGRDFLKGDARLVGNEDPISLQGVVPLAIRGNHLFLQTREGAGLLELGTGTLHHLMDAPSIEAVLPFRWGGPVAIKHFTKKCIRWPDKPSSCHTQIWGLSLWREEIGASQVAFASQPITVYAIGPDGSMVVGGRFLYEPPEIAEPEEVEISLHLLGADGRVIRELDRGSGIIEGIGGEYFAILERERHDGEVRSEELVAIDWKTGDETVLVSGRFTSTWGLDHSDRRLSAIVYPTERGFPEELWSGVVAR